MKSQDGKECPSDSWSLNCDEVKPKIKYFIEMNHFTNSYLQGHRLNDMPVALSEKSRLNMRWLVCLVSHWLTVKLGMEQFYLLLLAEATECGSSWRGE